MNGKSLSLGIIALVMLGVSSCQQPIVPSPEPPTKEITCVEAPLEMPKLTPRPASVAGIDKLQVSLNGTWHFNPNPQKDFWSAKAPTGPGWANIEVPGEWVMQGFTVAKDTAAGYWRQFIIPTGWKGHRIKLHCDAVYSDARVWVNGNLAGRHLGGFTPFELDVTDLVKFTRYNTIALAVKNESLADILATGSQYAAHQLGGITRKIYLFAVPKLNITSLHVATTFEKHYHHATLEVMLEIANESGKDIQYAQVQFELTDPFNKLVTIEPRIVNLPLIQAGQTIKQTIEIPVTAPKKWDAEHPNLYVLACQLKAADKPLETVQRRFGFRQVQIRRRQLFVNNTPVKLHGICRHEVHPLRGRSLTPELRRKDAELFRNANINYIRTSHYPPAEEFIEACDELGLFVEEEAPLCWVGHGANQTWRGWDPHSTKYLSAILRGTTEMIQRDRSHPSIIIWSLANESSWGPNFEKSFELTNLADPTRPKSFHDQNWGTFNNHSSTTQIANYHYPGPGGPARAEQSEKPLLFGEYCHLNTYNRQEIVTDPGVRDHWGHGFATMWEKMYTSEGCLGGAIWSGIDDIFHLPTGKSVGYGSWGPLDGWRRTKPEYWHIKKTYSPIKIHDKTINVLDKGQPIKLNIKNRHDFTNLSEIRIEWTLAGETGIAKANISPQTSGTIYIQPKSTDLDGEKLSLKFFSPRGFMIDSYLLPIGTSEETIPKPGISANDSLQLIKDDNNFTIKDDRFRWVFDRKTGLIQNAEIDGRSILIGGPVLMVLPLTGGKCEPTHSEEIQPFNNTCRNWKANKVTTIETVDSVEIHVDGQYEEASGRYLMKFYRSGRLVVDYRFTLNGKVNPRQMGIVFDLPKICDNLAWKRKAQWTVYPEDHIGRVEGQAKAFRDAKWPTIKPHTKPPWPWSLDSNALGTNDFRSTKRNIIWASLKNADGYGILVRSDSNQSTRSFAEGDRIRLLVAGYSTGGADMFFASHLANERKPLKKGTILEDTVHLELVSP